jgi:hypothetical protein
MSFPLFRFYVSFLPKIIISQLILPEVTTQVDMESTEYDVLPYGGSVAELYDTAADTK